MTVYMTFNEACDQLFNACDELLTESVIVEASENEAEAKAKKPEIFAKIKKILAKIWDFIIQVLRKIISKFDKISYVKLTEDLEVPKCALHPNTKFIGMVMRALDSKTEKFDLDEFEKYSDAMMADTIKFEKGKILNAKVIYNTCKQYKEWAEKCRKLADAVPDYAKATAAIFKNITADQFNTRITFVSKKADEVVAKLNDIAKYSEKVLDDNKAKVEQAKAEKAAKATTESATYFSDLAAKLLAEAAELVEPEKDDEYPADDASGGPGVMCDKDIKELLDDDKDALEILTKDEDSAIVENVVITF